MDQKRILLGFLLFVVVVFGWFVVVDQKSRHGSGKPAINERKSNWKWTDDWTSGNPSENRGPVETPPIRQNEKQEAPKEPQTQLIGSDYNDAVVKSAKSGKPMLIMFTADWCGYCKKMKEETLVDADVRKMMLHYVMVFVDVDKDRQTARKFQVSSLPTFVISNDKGEQFKLDSGFKKPDEFAKWLDNPELFKSEKDNSKKKPETPKPPKRRLFPIFNGFNRN